MLQYFTVGPPVVRRVQELSPKIRALQLALKRRYEIRREVGHGGAATVFLAHDLRHDRPVALKVLSADGQTEELEIRFAREIRFLARLQHPNILPLHDSGQISDLFYYVVPYVEGQSLRARLEREQRLSVDEAVRITSTIAEALDYAHRQGIIHRDIKPENILLSGVHPILADFGVARAIEVSGLQRLTRTGSGPGTPAYMSPEQLFGDAELDARTDIYSLGSVLYEMLTGVVPFPSREGLLKRLTQPPPPLSASRSDVPMEIEHAMLRALAPEPRDRFAAAGDFAAALTRARATPAASGSRPRVAAPSVAIVGRDAEIAEAHAVLDVKRLLTIVGAGGVGKTRLAVHVAAMRQYRYRDGSAIVSVLPGMSSEDLVAAIGEAIGVTFAGARSTRRQLLDALGDKHVLVVLDGFEHLIGAAPFIGELLHHGAGLSLIVTSRERLNIADETAMAIEGLSVGSTSDGHEAEDAATVLFIDRARQTDPHFIVPDDPTIIRRIARSVDGLPLGIEIAASLVRVLSCAEIAEELERDPGSMTTSRRDIPERQRSLRDVFEHSWMLLDDVQRSALMRLSVLRGPFSREAAQAVGNANLSVLASLIDKSLLHRTPDGRFALHEVVRQFADGKLREKPDLADAARDAQMEFFAKRCASLLPDLRGPKVYQAIDAIAKDLDGIRGGWRRAIDRDRADLLIAYAEIFFRFYLTRGRYADADQEFAEAERRPKHDLAAAFVLAKRGMVVHQGGRSGARALLRRSIDILRGIDRHSVELGISYRYLAYIASDHGRPDAALRLYDRALRLLRGRGSVDEVGWLLLTLSVTHTHLGQYEAAERALDECVAIFRKLDEPRSIMMALVNLSIVQKDRGLSEAGYRLLEEALEIARRTNDRWMLGAVLINLAESMLSSGEYESARQLLEEAREIHRTVGRPHGVCKCELFAARADRLEGRAEPATSRLRFVLGEALKLDVVPIVMEAALEYAYVCRMSDRAGTAKELARLVASHPGTPAYERRQAEAIAGQAVPAVGERPSADIIASIKRIMLAPEW